jgi:two-component system, chemotaxis family, protein-glutamate methylesterase/glutaminase
VQRLIRVLIVDDSALMRQMLTEILSSDPEIEVIDTASDPFIAREKIKTLNPDVVTLDVEMPRMDGLSFLEKIMTLRPMPVIMISSLTTEGADISLRALEIGAVDVIAKPTTAQHRFREHSEEIVAKVKAAAGARLRPLAGDRPSGPTEAQSHYRPNGRLVAIGASTGGVEALTAVLKALPGGAPPILIAQHMPARFVPSFAARLNGNCAVTVSEAQDGERIRPGHVYIAPGGVHLRVARSGTGFRCELAGHERVSGHCPSVDVLFNSFAEHVGGRSVGVILTGMGSDGADGLLAMRRVGARTIGQDQGSSLIYGMPRVAFEAGAVETQLPLGRVAAQILTLCSQNVSEASA